MPGEKSYAKVVTVFLPFFSLPQSMGIDFISYQENIDTTTPTGELIFHVMASLAQFESSLISQRVKAGMARAKAQGKQISRPKLHATRLHQILELQKTGLSMNQISIRSGVAYGTVYNYLANKRLPSESEDEAQPLPAV
jgi:DNA invertase Pin-like site-specific DNA recombinase